MASAESRPSKQPRLSVAIIARNEAGFLSDTVESVRPIADEILVLDTGSTDATVAQAQQLGVVVKQMDWPNDFSAARNRCLELVTGDWVLWVDAGERLDSRTSRELRTFIDHRTATDSAYLMMVEIPASNPRASNEQAARERLMPRRPDLRFVGRVRETLRPAVEQAHLTVAVAPGRILRHPRQQDPARKAARAQRNLDLITLEAADRQDYPPRLLLALGDAYGDLDNSEGARNAFLQVIGRTAKGSTEMLEAYYGLLTAMNSESQRHLQISTCLEALEIFPADAQLLMAMGNYLRASGRFDMAARSFEAAVERGRIDLETWHLCELGEMASICLSLTQHAMGNMEQALETLRKAASAYPNSNRVKRYWIELLATHGKFDEALQIVDRLTVSNELRQAIRDAVEGACHVTRKEWTQALTRLQSSYVGGFREPFNLRWLALILLQHGHHAAAEPVLREWLQLDPHNPEVWAHLGLARPQQSSSPPGIDSSAQRHVRVDGSQPGVPVDFTTTTTKPEVHFGS